MGEFIQVDGEEHKIGTVEDVYYFSYQELRALVESGRARRVGGNMDPREYLNPAHGWRYRFPFPDEDSTTPDEKWRRGHDRGFNVPAPAELFDGILHEGLTLSVNWHGGGGGLTYYAPCPYDPDNDPENWSNGIDTIPLMVQVTQQKQVEGKLWTVVRCAYCRAMWRLDPVRAQTLVDHVLVQAQRDNESMRGFLVELCARIMAGYQDGATNGNHL